MLEIGLYQKLRDDVGIGSPPSGGVVSWVSGRVFWGRTPDNVTLPAIVMTVVTTSDLGYTYQGASGLRKKMIQFDSYATKYTDAVKVSDAIRSLLQSYSGILPDGTSVNGCVVVGDRDMGLEPGTTGFVYRRMLEVDCYYTETFLPFITPDTLFPDLSNIDFTEISDEGEA
jgi:hypothetical protein